MEHLISHALDQAADALEQLRSPASYSFMTKSAETLAECFESGNKVLIAGNGGSLCDASHFAEELTGQFRQYRKALPAIALADPGHITCVGNDMGFDKIFSRAIEALGTSGDLFIGLTTSGNSPNMIQAFIAAQAKGMKTIAFLGKGGGQLKGVADLELIIDGFSSSDRIQEAHMVAIHTIIEVVETLLFSEHKVLIDSHK